MKTANNFVFTAYGTSNGSSGGTTSTSAGNIFISAYTGATNQQWEFELLQNPNGSTTPVGCLDSVTTTSIGGWAYQSSVPNTPLDVHIYITHNSTGQQTLVSTLANGYRSDLKNAGYGIGYHAFQYNINWKTYKPGTYTVSAYAIGTTGIHPQLDNSPKTFTVRNPAGNVEYLSADGIGGWLWKPDAPNSAIDVHIYIYDSSGAQVEFYVATANQPRPDLAELGYGNGAHGFSKSIDWASLPKEELRVVAYAVDGSDYNPSFYEGYYDNRKPIYLLGLVESAYQHDLSAWSRTSDARTYCANIGYSSLHIARWFSANQIRNSIKNSSYCVIYTHGDAGEYMQYGVKNENNEPVYDWYSNAEIEALPNNYFDTTKCVVLMACCSGLGRETKTDNLVNTIHRKGVDTVVGFETSIIYCFNDYDESTNEDDVVITDAGGQLWITTFTKLLGEGYSVKDAKNQATDDVEELQEEYERKYGDDGEDNKLGLGSCYIAGDENQIVKH